MHYCDHALSVVRPSSLTFHIFDSSSETAKRNLTKLNRKVDLNVLYLVCVFFGPIRKTRWPPWPLIDWDIFDFSSEHNSTKLERKQDLNVLYHVCIFQADRKKKMAALASDWLRHFRLLFLKPLNRIQWNLTVSKISMSSTKFVFFGPIGKTRWPLWPLIGWDIFDFSSETTERNSTKLHRKQDLNVLYQVCIFRAVRKNKMASLASDWLRHFGLLWNRWPEFNETCQEARSRPGKSVKIVAHCTQVHDMWPFGPLVFLFLFFFFFCLLKFLLQMKIRRGSRIFFPGGGGGVAARTSDLKFRLTVFSTSNHDQFDTLYCRVLMLLKEFQTQ